jgi:hypothetical protein
MKSVTDGLARGLSWFKSIVDQPAPEKKEEPKPAKEKPNYTTYHGWIPPENLVQKIVGFEVGSIRYYNRFLTTPLNPLNDASGLTIGIGYDLGHVTEETFRRDWQGFIPSGDIERLAPATGLRGDNAKRMHRSVVGVSIPFEVAMRQFMKVTLPIWIMKAYELWPNFDSLNNNQKTALVSLTFNRGTALQGHSRVEMREVRDLLMRGNIRPVAGLIKAMARRSGLKGVQARRVAEAELFAS